MLKGQIALTAVRPTPTIPGGTVIPIGQTVTIKGFNNQYVCSEGNTQPMICNRAVAQSWEQFTVVDAGGGRVALRNQGNYVCSENGTQAVNCNRASVGPWEQFEWISNSDGTISFRGNNGAYLSAEDGMARMTCTKTTIGAAEKFKINQ